VGEDRTVGVGIVLATIALLAKQLPIVVIRVPLAAAPPHLHLVLALLGRRHPVLIYPPAVGAVRHVDLGRRDHVLHEELREGPLDHLRVHGHRVPDPASEDLIDGAVVHADVFVADVAVTVPVAVVLVGVGVAGAIVVVVVDAVAVRVVVG